MESALFNDVVSVYTRVVDNKSQYIMIIISPFIFLKIEKPISLRNTTHLLVDANTKCT